MKTLAKYSWYFISLIFLAGCCTPVTLSTWKLNDTNLSTKSPGKVIIDNSCLTFTESLCGEQVQQAFLEIRLNTGEIYNYGTNAFRSTVTLELIKADKGSSPVIVETIVLKIYPNTPEILYNRDITSWYSSSKSWSAWLNLIDYDRSDVIAKDIQLVISVDKTTSPSPVSLVDPSKTLINSISYSGTNVMTFWWECPCAFSQYEFQIIKLYNLDPDYKDEKSCSTTLDWSNATSILTTEKKIELSVGEGSGFYAWRVRPIAYKYPGGFSDDRNWGVWSSSRTELYKEVTESLDHDDVFYHESIGDDKNWIFSRTFSENTKQAEQVTFYSGLLFEKQSQRHLFTDNLNYIKPKFYDYTGRAALTSLGVPINFSYFQYQKNLLTRDGILYGPPYFDDDLNYDSSLAATGGTIHDYWSDENPDLNIPSAHGYPFSRTLYYPDGTNKPKEFGNVDSIFRLGGDRTIKTYFTSATEGELVSMFGDEAPDEDDVFKTIVVDPNKTITVTYTDKSGEKLAAHLLLNGDTLVEKLPSATEDTLSTLAEVIYNEQINNYTIKSTKKFVWTIPTLATIHYEITPQDIEEECGSFCWSCDYEISIFKKELETNETTVLRQLTIPGDQCYATASLEFDTSETLEGTWEIGRIITVNNKNSRTNDNYLDEHLTEISENFETGTVDSLDPLFLLLHDYELEKFYAAIRNGDPDNDGVRNVTFVSESDSTIQFKTGCCEFLLPKVDCDENCPATGEEYEKLLIDTWGPSGNGFVAADGNKYNYGCSVYEYFYDPLELAGRKNKYPAPSGNDFYGYFKKLDYSSSILLENYDVHFTIKLCNGKTYDPIDLGFSLIGYPGTLAERVSEKLNEEFTSKSIKYKAKTVGNRIKLSTNISDSDFPFVSPEAEATLSVVTTLTSGLDYKDTIEVIQQTSSGYPAGNGAFAKLIDNMLADGYDTCTLWYCWQSLVSNYDSLSYEGGDTTGERKDFDLLDAFLQCAGKQYLGVCINPYYNSVAGGGFLDKAHKYFYCDTLHLTGDCEYDSSWPPDTRGGNLYEDTPSAFSVDCDFIDAGSTSGSTTSTGTSKKWEEFYTCLTSGTSAASEIVSEATGIEECTDVKTDAEAKECLEEIVGAIEDSCIIYCEQRLDGFYEEILSYYEEHHLPIDSCMILCKAYTMMDSCKKNCSFTVDDIMKADVWGSAGVASIEEFLLRDNICTILEGLIASMTYEWEYAEPTVDSTVNIYWIPVTTYDHPNENEYDNGSITWIPFYTYVTQLQCPDSFALYYDYLFSDLRCYIDSLNSKFSDYGKTKPDKKVDAAAYWDIFEAVLSHEDFLILLSCSSSPYFAPDSLWSIPYTNYYFYIDEPCNLMVAIIDTTGDTTNYLICDRFACLKSCPVCIKTVPPTFKVQDTITVISCEEESAEYLTGILERQLEDCRDSILDAFESNYQYTCADPVNIKDHLTVSYQEARYHFTLYYYDRAGNLVTTVPPKGAKVDDSYTRLTHPQHTFKTIYNYNSLGQLVQSVSPDGGKTTYIYDDIGLLRFSQNAKQVTSDRYSYIKYDNLGRIIETGENNSDAANLDSHRNDLEFPTATGTERTFTVYTTPASVTYLDGTAQRFLRNNVSYMYNDDKVYTYYSYDPHGNVEWMIQDIPGLGKNYIKYVYDLISGLVTEVKYNEGLPDQFYHRYSYDADNRIKEVQTSSDHEIWDTDARYQYYGYGPLKRMTLGEDFVQGLDYVYTIQGWLKAINHPSLEIANDPGHDSDPSGANPFVAKDVHALTLSYFPGDFNRESPSGTSSPFNMTNPYAMTVANPLYDGNISVQVTSNAVHPDSIRYGSKATAFNYNYDELSRLLQSTFNYYNGSSSEWIENQEYHSQYSYDPNGNILTLNRNGVDGDTRGLDMDRLTYHYPLSDNQLDYVDDAGNINYTNDLRDQNAGNYKYDELGNLIKDKSEGIDEIQWNLQGKVKSISKTDGTKLSFGYDAMGNRAWKTVSTPTSSDSATYYVRNATGAPLAIYPQYKGPDISTSVEFLIYGQSRLGQCNLGIIKKPISGKTSESSLIQRSLGDKLYELSNHIKNVQSTLSDIKLSILDASYYPLSFTAERKNYQSYYPYGSMLPDNVWSPSMNRYGFEGIEKDDEINGTGNSFAFEARLFDPRTVRWQSLDPMAAKYPSLSPYNAMGDNPVHYVDPNGRLIEYAPGTSEDFKNKFALAVQTMNENGYGATLAQLQAMPQVVWVMEGGSLLDDAFHPSGIEAGGLTHWGAQPWHKSINGSTNENIIIWDPNGGLAIADAANNPIGGRTSPIVNLYHELKHAFHYLTNAHQFDTDMGTPVAGGFDNQEEKNAVTEESGFAAKLGVGVRKNHRGLNVTTTSVNSINAGSVTWQEGIQERGARARFELGRLYGVGGTALGTKPEHVGDFQVQPGSYRLERGGLEYGDLFGPMSFDYTVDYSNFPPAPQPRELEDPK